MLKVLLRLVPTTENAAIAATAINAAINAYSIAVTADSSLIRLVNSVRNRILLAWDYDRAQIAIKSLSNGKPAVRCRIFGEKFGCEAIAGAVDSLPARDGLRKP